MPRRLEEMFLPLARMLRLMAEAESTAPGVFAAPAPPQAVDGDQGRSAGSAALTLPDQDGDVTDVLAAKATAKEKAELCEKPNQDARMRRSEALRREIHGQAAAVLRSRLVAVSSAESAKVYMETSNSGLVARTIVVDVTKPRSRQTGLKSLWPSLAAPRARHKRQTSVPCMTNN